MDQMKAKSVLITGTDRGIGLEMVKQFLSLPNPPVHLFACGLSPETSAELQRVGRENPTVTVLKMDVSDVSSIDSAAVKVEEILLESGLNLLINVAGIDYNEGSIDDVTVQTMRHHFEVNCIGPVMVIKKFLPLLRKASQFGLGDTMSASRAAIFNFSSKVGSLDDNRSGRNLGYRCSKVALNMVTKNLSIELKSDNILSVSLHPGWVKTIMGGKNALISPQESVQGLITVMATRHNEHNGYFYDYKGEPIPW
ncbi:C-signal-like [Ptychodera flava]|uniref:C-signal-like n=1 Tax=Ptychodera flava TaxID=63121 RepID=UPI00396A4C5D